MTTSTDSTDPTDPTDSGYLELGDLRLYYEQHGDRAGSPVVLLHGGMMSIDLSWAGLLPLLSARHRVIGLDAQGHGRSNDVDREITPASSATDVVALLDQLGIDRAHVVGHSMGGGIALQLAVTQPDRLLSVVPMSASVRPDGIHGDLQDPSKFATSDRMPTAEDFTAMQETYRRLSPHPDQFDAFMAKMSASNADLVGWNDEQLAGITTPVLLVIGDHDFTTVEHGAQMLELIPGSQLAVLPGTTHMQVPRRTDLLAPMLAEFLG